MGLRNHVAGPIFFAPLALSSLRGEYMLDLQIDISSGQLYGGVLDIEKNEFIVQQELQSGSTQFQFALAEDRLIDVIVRQGADDTPVRAIYRYGQLGLSAGLEEPSIGEFAEENPGVTQAVRPPEAARHNIGERGSPIAAGTRP